MSTTTTSAGATAFSSSTTGGRQLQHQRRTTVVQWIRKTHGWIGLWGAILGLIFGIAGIWLNHRAVLKLPMSQQRINAQLTLPDPAPSSADDMAIWLQSALGQSRPPNAMRIEPSRPVAWTEKAKRAASSDAASAGDTSAQPKPEPTGAPLMQPEHWIFNFGGPDAVVQADYWRGNRSLGVTTTSNGFVATMTNLHKGVGMPVAWILLVDTLAGSMIFLSVSGVALWMLTHRRRRAGLVIFGVSAALTLGSSYRGFDTDRRRSALRLHLDADRLDLPAAGLEAGLKCRRQLPEFGRGGAAADQNAPHRAVRGAGLDEALQLRRNQILHGRQAFARIAGARGQACQGWRAFGGFLQGDRVETSIHGQWAGVCGVDQGG